MKKIVLVSTVFPFPVDNGKKVVIWGILKYLIERYGAGQVTYVTLGLEDEASPVTDFPCKYVALGKPGSLYRLWNVLWFALVRKSKSIQELMIYSPNLGRKLRTIIAEINPDLVVCDTFRTGQFLETPRRPHGIYVLYMDDLFSVRYQKTLEVLRRFPQIRMDPLGNFARFVPSMLRPLVRLRFAQKWILKLERNLVEKRERNCVSWFNKCLLINSNEASLLHKKSGHPSILTVKPLLESSGSGLNRRYAGKPVFVFLGSLNLPHNHLSIVHFIDSCMDEIVEKIPGAKLRVIGRGQSDELVKHTERWAGAVSLEGFVEDLDAVFAESCAMVVPLLFGSGVKIKTLEALARGLPVISTDFGVEGIAVTNNVDCVVENDIARYPQLMAAATDMTYNSAMSEAARTFYIENYSEEQVTKEYDPLFEANDSE